MSVKFPNSPQDMHYRDMEHLEGTLAYLTGRLREEERQLRGARDRSRRRALQMNSLRRRLKSLALEEQLITVDVGDGRTFTASNVVEVVLVGVPVSDGNVESSTGALVGELKVKLRVRADPDGDRLALSIEADDNDVLLEAVGLTENKIQISGHAAVHLDRLPVDDQSPHVAHDSSPSVGAAPRGQSVGGAPEPTEGEARKGRDDNRFRA